MTKEKNIIDFKSGKFQFSSAAGEVTSLLLRPEASSEQIFRELLDGNDENNILIPSKPSSFPWLNVAENIKFFNSNLSDEELQNLISLVGLEGYEDHFPNNKSIGFRFRISLARALSVGAEALLIDNPFPGLSPERRAGLFSVLRKAASERNVAILFGLKSVTDAIRLSDKIILQNIDDGGFETVKKIFIDDRDRENIRIKINVKDYFEDAELNEIL